MSPALPKSQIRNLLRPVCRHYRLLVYGWMLFAVGALVASHWIPLKYRGKAIFELGLEATAQDFSKSSADSFGTMQERLVHDVTSYQAFEQACAELYLTEGLPRDGAGQLTNEGQAALQAMIEEFHKNAEVVFEARSKQEDLVSVSFANPDPGLAQDMPNALVKGYINRSYDHIRSNLKGQYDFLAGKMGDVNKRLDAAQREKVEFETAHAGMLPENPSAFQEKMERNVAELQAARRRAEVSRLQLARLTAIKEHTTTNPSELAGRKFPNPDYNVAKRQLHVLGDELQTDQTIRHMTDAHPALIALKLQIEQAEANLATLPETIEEPADSSPMTAIDLSMGLAAAKSELDASENDITRLEATRKDYDKAWANFSPVRQSYLALLRKQEEASGEMTDWRNRLEAAQVTLAAAMDNQLTRLSAVQPAQQQFLPAYPPLLMVLALALAGGLALGGALVYLAEAMDRTVTSPEQATEYFHLPIHGVIGEIIEPAQRKKGLVRKWVLAPLATGALLLALGLAGLSTVLRLQYPPLYQQFRQSPTEFLGESVHPTLHKATAAVGG